MGLSLKKPSREPAMPGVPRRPSDLGSGEKRLVADIPGRVHRQLRLRCLEQGISVREYILDMLAKDGIGEEPAGR